MQDAPEILFQLATPPPAPATPLPPRRSRASAADVREMLFQVFSALDVAQRKLGFFHADLGMRNVMEHFPK